MIETRWPAFVGLVVGTAWLTSIVDTSFAFDKPTYAAIVCLTTLAVILLALGRFLPKGDTPTHKGHYLAVPLQETHANGAPRDHSPHPHHLPDDLAHQPSLRKLRILFVVLVLAICARAELVREIVANVQCSRGTWEPVVPLTVAIWDWISIRRRRRHQTELDDQTATIYDVWESRIMNSSYRYLVVVALVCFGSFGAIRAIGSPPSTHICTSSLPYSWYIPLAQYVGTALDCIIVFCVHGLLYTDEKGGTRGPSTRFSAVGWAFLFAAATLSTIACIYYYASDPDDRRKILSIPDVLFWGTTRLDIVVCLTVISALFCTYFVGAMSTSMIVMFVSVSVRTTSFAWNHTHPFPVGHVGLGFLAMCLTILGFAFYFHMGVTSETEEANARHLTFRKAPVWLYLAMLCLLAVQLCLWAVHKSSVGHHPIDLLMWEANTRHEAYVKQASASTTLEEAVRNYRQRYGRHPPPGFDHWYKYATDRGSIIIDDYDSIHRDLLPFYALSPEEIRDRTWRMIANPFNDASGISIRNGKAEISPNVMPTHRWMLDGIIEMIGHFAEWLPDMDLAFNMNDECRVAVPYEQIKSMREAGRQFGDLNSPVENTFTPQRGHEWKPFTEEPLNETPLIHRSFQRTFLEFGSVGCPPNSPARTKRHWDTSKICTSCTAPHSLGAFLSNWTKAADVCHQPDLADSHGFYLSPAAFKGAHELFPIFSQSKAHGFNDILYPSAWNYMDKAVYHPNDEFPDPPFAHKNTTLFWRGATSEGVSPGHGQWRGMTRQRMVALTSPESAANTPPQPLLLPSGKKQSYAALPAPLLARLLPASVRIVSTIHRCGGRDCPDQAAAFAPLADPTDFQSHWSYAHLLDLDGAGFSGRFLPFLASRSLPLKAALFREWWDDRLTAWLHFAPLDLRGQGLWATLAYFAGVEGRVRGRREEGERIAGAGREWAGQVLRKEDMEVYFFRLLLEWGRLTDGRRGEVGFGWGVE